MIPLIQKYFPGLTAEQADKFRQLQPLYREWNEKINVISRLDIENLEERHILHSLAIARVLMFKPGSSVLDLGTGGGFPGIPLAILFPETNFVLVDGTGKKIRVVEEVASALKLINVVAIHGRAEDIKMNGQFDFVVSRAVASLDKLLVWGQKFLKRKHTHVLPNGILALKGGDISAEIRELPGKGKEYTEVFPIRNFYQEPFFDEKWVVYVQG